MIYLVRHAESVSNAGNITSDINNILLSAKGEEQARVFAETINNRPDLVIMSPLARAKQTAQPIIDKFPGVATEVWDIQEFTFLPECKYVNTTKEERFEMGKEYVSRNDPDYVMGEGAESFNQMLGRVKNMLDRLKQIDSGKFVLVFTHGRIMRVVQMLDRKMTIDIATLISMPQIPNTGVIELKF